MAEEANKEDKEDETGLVAEGSRHYSKVVSRTNFVKEELGVLSQ
jgi:hypothetical protein